MGGKEKQWFYRPDEHKSYWNREEHTIEENPRKIRYNRTAQGDRVATRETRCMNPERGRSPRYHSTPSFWGIEQKTGNNQPQSSKKETDELFFWTISPCLWSCLPYPGNGWRVNKLDDCPSRIKLTSPQFKITLCIFGWKRPLFYIWGGCG